MTDLLEAAVDPGADAEERGVLPVLPPGAEVAPGYEVVELMTRGEALDVYDVWSTQRFCRCVAKALRPDRVRDERPRQRLLSEGSLLERFAHPHLVRAYETIEEPSPVVILEALCGETLSYSIEARTRRLPVVELAFLGGHLCSALGYLHAQGYLHRDLKPDNVICDRGLAKLIDLSLAGPPGLAPRHLGTRAYMAPEQAAGEPLGSYTDVWGLGTVLYEAATGVPAFDPDRDGAPHPQLVRRADPVAGHRRLPSSLATAIDACLEPQPAARPTVAAVADVLDALTPFGRRGLPYAD